MRRDEGIPPYDYATGYDNPSGTAAPRHLPLHKGGWGECLFCTRKAEERRRGEGTPPYGHGLSHSILPF